MTTLLDHAVRPPLSHPISIGPVHPTEEGCNRLGEEGGVNGNGNVRSTSWGRGMGWGTYRDDQKTFGIQEGRCERLGSTLVLTSQSLGVWDFPV